jgi:hypothetical protein
MTDHGDRVSIKTRKDIQTEQGIQNEPGYPAIQPSFHRSNKRLVGEVLYA